MAGRLRVLIVDADALFRLTLRGLLEPDFEIVGEAADCDEALGLAAAGGVDLIVADVGMPRLSGIDTNDATLDRDPALAIVIINASNEAAGPAERERPASARAFVRKSSALHQLGDLLVALGALAERPE